jgi:glutamyl-Q tRNA(Asp) synthetase
VPTTNHPQYRGRFAPSPTGPLHLGSLIAALASYLDARHHGGAWLVRMEDLDPPREVAGAADEILQGLQKHGMHWDGDVQFQSERGTAYAAALRELALAGHLFHCDCTRARVGPGGSCQGGCRQRQDALREPTAIRVTIPADCHIEFEDQVQGVIGAALGADGADFVVKRKDGLDAYQLAVVVDDAWQGITHIIRGSDLLDSTARQIFLQQVLGYPTPHYSHIPVITDQAGIKFSKQSHAPAMDDREAPANLRAALQFLQQAAPPAHLDTPGKILASACRNWAPQNIPATLSIPARQTG